MQTFAKVDDDCAKLFVKRDVDGVGERDIYHCRLQAVVRGFAPDASEGGLAVPICGKTKVDSGKTRKLLVLDVIC